MRDINTNVPYRGLWGALSNKSLIILCAGSSCSRRRQTSGLRSVGCQATEFWVGSSLSSSSSPLQHVSCGRVRLDPAEAVARKAHCLSAWHCRLQERGWLCFLPGRVICTEVRRERNWLVSDRISKHRDLILCPKCKYILSLAGEGHEGVWHHHKGCRCVKQFSNCVAVWFCNFFIYLPIYLVCVFYLHVCLHTTCVPVPAEARSHIPSVQNYNWLRAAMGAMGFKLRSSARTASTLNC